MILAVKYKEIHTLKELCTKVSSRSMTIHFLCISWCLTGGRSGLGRWSFMTRRGGEALPSTLLVPFPGGPLPRPPRQQHSNDRKNPPLPLDFFPPSAGTPDTGLPSPSLCCPPGDDPKTTIPHKSPVSRSERRALKVAPGMLPRPLVSICLPQTTHPKRTKHSQIDKFTIYHNTQIFTCCEEVTLYAII